MKAKDAKAGDLFVMVALPIRSVMTEGTTTMLFWGDQRAMDAIDSEADVTVYPRACLNCGRVMVEKNEDEEDE